MIEESKPPAKTNTLAAFIMDSHNFKGPVSKDRTPSYADQYEDKLAESILDDELDGLDDEGGSYEYPTELVWEELEPDDMAEKPVKRGLAGDIIDYSFEEPEVVSLWPGRISNTPKELKYSSALIQGGMDQTEVDDLPLLFSDVTLHYPLNQIIDYMSKQDQYNWINDPFRLPLPNDLMPPPELVPPERLDTFVMCRNLSIAGLQKRHQEDSMLNLMLNFCKADGWHNQVAQTMAMDIYVIYTLESERNPSTAEQIAMDSVMSAYRWEFQRQFPSLMYPLSPEELSDKRSAIESVLHYRDSFNDFLNRYSGNTMQHNQPQMVQAVDANGTLMYHNTPQGREPIWIPLEPQQQYQQPYQPPAPPPQPDRHQPAYQQALSNSLHNDNTQYANPNTNHGPSNSAPPYGTRFQRRSTPINTGGSAVNDRTASPAAQSMANEIINKTTRRSAPQSTQWNRSSPNDEHYRVRNALLSCGYSEANRLSSQQLAFLNYNYGENIPTDIIELKEHNNEMIIVYSPELLDVVTLPTSTNWPQLYNKRMFDKKYYFNDKSSSITEIFIAKRLEDMDYSEHELKAQLPDKRLAEAVEKRKVVDPSETVEDETVDLPEAVESSETVYASTLDEAVFKTYYDLESNDSLDKSKVEIFSTKAWVTTPYILSKETLKNDKLVKTMKWLERGSNLNSFDDLVKLMRVLRTHASNSVDMFLRHLVTDLEERVTDRFNSLMRYQLNLPADLNNFVDDYAEFVNEVASPETDDPIEAGLWRDAGAAILRNETKLVEQMKFVLPAAEAKAQIEAKFGEGKKDNVFVLGSMKLITNSIYCNDLMGMSDIDPNSETYSKNGMLISQKKFAGLYALARKDLATALELNAEVVYVPADGKPINLFNGLYNPDSVIAIRK